MSLNKEWKKIYKRSLAGINSNKIDPLEYKESLLNEINNHTENGMIGLLTGGTDCDGYRWLGYDIIKATLQSYNKWLKEFNRGLDGPAGFKIVVPSIAIERKKG
tara:strand:- start:1409 stop:1720 length:312 start_codon:yes stop_codon:yes gene_type:complete